MADHKLGIYYAPAHGRAGDVDYAVQLQPRVVKIQGGGTPDVRQVADMHQAAPGADVVLRSWALDDNELREHAATARDPRGTGRRHAEEWRREVSRLQEEARERGLPFPAEQQLIVHPLNEPHVWDWREQAVDYTEEFLEVCRANGLRAGALAISVGHPSEWPRPDWRPYARLEDVINRGDHVLLIHEYWHQAGPGADWGALAGRYMHCPLQTPIVIGECGIDHYTVDAGVPQHKRGWRAWVAPQTFAGQVGEYLRRINEDGRIVAACPFLTDYASRDWQSFDTEPAHGHLIEAARRNPAPSSTSAQLPIPADTGTVADGDQLAPTETPVLVNTGADFLWPICEGIVSQHWMENLEPYRSKYGILGHNGVDIAAPEGTKIRAFADGVVAWVGFDEGYGNYVRIWHPQLQCHSFVAHLQKWSVEAGAHVEKGQEVGRMGSTGNSSGSHAHIEIRLGTGIHDYFETGNGHWRGRIDALSYVGIKNCH